MEGEPRVLFVSKPIVAPWNDGEKNLVRDIAAHLTRARPTVMATPGAAAIGARVTLDPVYRDGSTSRRATLVGSARQMQRLLRGDPHDVWHFLSSPTASGALTARLAVRARKMGGWRGAVVQTVASAPEAFEAIGRGLFGDAVVVMSEWMRGRLLGAGVNGDAISVIPPCASPPRDATEAERAAVRARYSLGSGPVVLYPGDYDISRGAETMARAVPAIARALPEARIVFACGQMTRAAAAASELIQAGLREAKLHAKTRHVGDVDDMPALLATASVLAFPVDDLALRADVPLVVIEALALGKPLVLVRGGSLEAIGTAAFIDPGDADALARETLRLIEDEAAAHAMGERGKELYGARFRPAVVAAAYDDLYARMLAR